MILGVRPLEEENPRWATAQLFSLEQLLDFIDDGWLPLRGVAYEPAKVAKLLTDLDAEQFARLLKAAGVNVPDVIDQKDLITLAVNAEREHPELLRKIFERFVFEPNDNEQNRFALNLIYSANYWILKTRNLKKRSQQ